MSVFTAKNKEIIVKLKYTYIVEIIVCPLGRNRKFSESDSGYS